VDVAEVVGKKIRDRRQISSDKRTVSLFFGSYYSGGVFTGECVAANDGEQAGEGGEK
jgi:hypothetical protein